MALRRCQLEWLASRSASLRFRSRIGSLDLLADGDDEQQYQAVAAARVLLGDTGSTVVR